MEELKTIKAVTLDGIKEPVKVDYIGGGDMKYLRNMLGLNNSNSDYGCMFCTHNFKDEIDFENGYECNRSQEEAKRLY